jgi:hypothetical protein
MKVIKTCSAKQNSSAKFIYPTSWQKVYKTWSPSAGEQHFNADTDV